MFLSLNDRIELKVCLQDNALAMVEEAEELTDALRTQVLFAREYLKSVTIGPKQACSHPHHGTWF